MTLSGSNPELVSIQEETLAGTGTELHRLRTEDSAELVLTRVPPSDTDNQHNTPVLLVHGNFSNRGFWVSSKGVGVGPFLAAQGYDVWVAELRGHGLSPKDPDFAAISADDHINIDLPGILSYRRICAERQSISIWLYFPSTQGRFCDS